jgi:hypothetical protein
VPKVEIANSLKGPSSQLIAQSSKLKGGEAHSDWLAEVQEKYLSQSSQSSQSLEARRSEKFTAFLNLNLSLNLFVLLVWNLEFGAWNLEFFLEPQPKPKPIFYQ